MTFSEQYKQGHLVLPADLFFHYNELFTSAEDFVVWQFFYLENTTKMDELPPSRIASALGKTLTDINRSISNLTNQGLLDMKTVDINGEIEAFFDVLPAFEKLDILLSSEDETAVPKVETNYLKELVVDFERELGRMLSPFELEDLQKMLNEDQIDSDLIREALKESVFNGKTNWKYITAILRNWKREGITTLRQVEENRHARENQQLKAVEVSDDFLNAMDLWSGE